MQEGGKIFLKTKEMSAVSRQTLVSKKQKNLREIKEIEKRCLEINHTKRETSVQLRHASYAR